MPHHEQSGWRLLDDKGRGAEGWQNEMIDGQLVEYARDYLMAAYPSQYVACDVSAYKFPFDDHPGEEYLIYIEKIGTRYYTHQELVKWLAQRKILFRKYRLMVRGSD